MWFFLIGLILKYNINQAVRLRLQAALKDLGWGFVIYLNYF